MRFDHAGETYALEFTRVRLESGRTIHDRTGGAVTVGYTYPYTVARLRRVRPDVAPRDWPIFREATVGCWHNDPYTLEGGRVHALRALTATLPPEMKPLVWAAYASRPRRRSAQTYRRALQAIMQVLGPAVPVGVDYTDPDNAAGLMVEQAEALRLLGEVGIVYRRRPKPRR